MLSEDGDDLFSHVVLYLLVLGDAEETVGQRQRHRLEAARANTTLRALRTVHDYHCAQNLLKKMRKCPPSVPVRSSAWLCGRERGGSQFLPKPVRVPEQSFTACLWRRAGRNHPSAVVKTTPAVVSPQPQENKEREKTRQLEGEKKRSAVCVVMYSLTTYARAAWFMFF